MSIPRRAVVIGGGFGGLVAARELRRRGVDTTVLEAGPQLAGLARSHTDPDGFSYDTGAHFVTNRLAAAVGASAHCRVVRRYGETVLLDGRYYQYPDGLLRNGRMVTSALAARARRHDAPAVSAADFFRREYGRELADRVALPLLEAWSGAPADELAASVAAKIPGGILATLRLRAAAAATKRAVAIGYCQERPQSAAVFHVYPDDGVAALCSAVAADVGEDNIRLRTPARGIAIENDSVVGVETDEGSLDADLVVSTAPINRLPDLGAAEPLEVFRSFRFRPMVFVNIKCEGVNLLRDVVVWVPQGAPFFRLTEAPQSMPWLAPEGKTVVLCDIGAEIGDAMWAMDDDALAELCLVHLERIVPDIRRRYLGASVLRVPLAYPVFLREYEPARERLATSTGVAGLWSVGRNGEFAHVLMEDIYWRVVTRMRRELAA